MMLGTLFQIDLLAVFFVAIVGSVFWWMRRKWDAWPKPVLRFSRVDIWPADHRPPRVRLAGLPGWLLLLAAACFGVALTDPHFLVPRDGSRSPEQQQGQEAPADDDLEEVTLPTEGIALYFVLDRSGSMRKPIGGEGRRRGKTRIELLKEVTRQFIRGDARVGLEGRPNDLIGLVSFARVAEVIAPLTLDHRTLDEKLAELHVVDEALQDGTAIGYAIFKTVNLIVATEYFAQQMQSEKEEPYTIKSKVVVLVTDGLNSPHILDQNNEYRTLSVQDAAAKAEEAGIRLYVINIEPLIEHPQLKRERDALVAAAERTGGKFYVAGDATALLDVYQEIDSLERSQLPGQRRLLAEIREQIFARPDADAYDRFSLHPYLIAAGLIFLGLGVALETTWLRRVP